MKNSSSSEDFIRIHCRQYMTSKRTIPTSTTTTNNITNMSSSSQRQSAYCQRQALEQLNGDKSLPSYKDATKGQSPVETTEKTIEIENVKKQSKLSSLTSIFKDKTPSTGPSDKQYNYVVSKNGGQDNYPFQHRNQMRFGC
ncbi:hypothetical protein BST61_g8622 [Cercospora zeina]